MNYDEMIAVLEALRTKRPVEYRALYGDGKWLQYTANDWGPDFARCEYRVTPTERALPNEVWIYDSPNKPRLPDEPYNAWSMCHEGPVSPVRYVRADETIPSAKLLKWNLGEGQWRELPGGEEYRLKP